eukprot:4222578-Prymnesium_polylepis.1
MPTRRARCSATPYARPITTAAPQRLLPARGRTAGCRPSRAVAHAPARGGGRRGRLCALSRVCGACGRL